MNQTNSINQYPGEINLSVKRSPTLENQIESMLDRIIGDENEKGSLHFSEEEEFQNKESPIFLSPQKPSNSPDKFQRSSKKYPTISFNRYYGNAVHKNNNYPNSLNCICYNVYPNVMIGGISICQKPNNMYNQNFIYNNTPHNNIQNNPNNFKRSDDRKKSYETKNMKDVQEQLMNINPNSHDNQFGGGRKEKRFNTTTFPKGGDIQVEMLLYEINDDLVKMEKIDFFIYNKLKGHFTNVIKTHKGSRIFQNFLKKTPCDIIHLIFTEIKTNLVEIMCDFYGNYFCKKFFGALNKKDRIDFITSIKGYFVKLSFDNVGTFPIQGIIEQVNSNYEKKMIISLVKNCLSLFCYNSSGSHVIEKIISCFEDEYTQFIFDFGIQNFIDLSKDSSGICVIKKIIIIQKEKTQYFDQIKKIIIDNLQILINHQFGNQVIQTAIQYWGDENVEIILKLIQNNYAALSMGKYSSNVIEKCIEKKEEILCSYINEICGKNQIGQVMKNSFGNYVIQKALKIARGNNEKVLADYVNKNIYKLNDKKLIAKWKNIVSPHLEINNSYSSNNNNVNVNNNVNFSNIV